MAPISPTKLSKTIKPPKTMSAIVIESNEDKLINESTSLLSMIFFKNESGLQRKMADIMNMAKPIKRNKLFMIVRTIRMNEPQQPVLSHIVSLFFLLFFLSIKKLINK